MSYILQCRKWELWWNSISKFKMIIFNFAVMHWVRSIEQRVFLFLSTEYPPSFHLKVQVCMRKVWEVEIVESFLTQRGCPARHSWPFKDSLGGSGHVIEEKLDTVHENKVSVKENSEEKNMKPLPVPIKQLVEQKISHFSF